MRFFNGLFLPMASIQILVIVFNLLKPNLLDLIPFLKLSHYWCIHVFYKEHVVLFDFYAT